MIYRDYMEAALSTAIYPQHPFGIYTSLGIAEEAGEVCGKFKKLMRDDRWLPHQSIPQEKRMPIALELGDVCWYIFMVIHEDNLVFNLDRDVNESQQLAYEMAQRGIIYNVKQLLHECEAITKRHHRNQIRVCVTWALLHIQAIAYDCGYTLQQIFQMNIDKLADRKARNTLHGSGDNR